MWVTAELVREPVPPRKEVEKQVPRKDIILPGRTAPRITIHRESKEELEAAPPSNEFIRSMRIMANLSTDSYGSLLSASTSGRQQSTSKSLFHELSDAFAAPSNQWEPQQVQIQEPQEPQEEAPPQQQHKKEKEQEKEKAADMSEVAGVGISIQQQSYHDHEVFLVVGMNDSGPAATCGMISVGDELVAIDNWSVEGATPAELLAHLVGPMNSMVMLSIYSKSAGQMLHIVLQRTIRDVGKRARTSSSTLPPPPSSLLSSPTRPQDSEAKYKAELFVSDLFSSTKSLIRMFEEQEDTALPLLKSSSSSSSPSFQPSTSSVFDWQSQGTSSQVIHPNTTDTSSKVTSSSLPAPPTDRSNELQTWTHERRVQEEEEEVGDGDPFSYEEHRCQDYLALNLHRVAMHASHWEPPEPLFYPTSYSKSSNMREAEQYGREKLLPISEPSSSKFNAGMLL